MFIAICIIELDTSDSISLKEKRNILRSIKDRTRSSFNIAISEIARQNDISNGILSAVSVSSDAKYLNGLMDKALDSIERKFPGRIIKHELHVEKFASL
ncbi:MAG: DUF503 domain-containing protein [Spirochaetes bacterium]|nr:DUF503 domain-containing protein [Spirochaetota bacterium]